ncbi:40S ribosomal S10-like protein, putative [Medicago truncatula]|uniref:40S ribosomal S10-like protein, putative n=1 Tax=Medicago truncatula TaxID=3880 RepID=G7J0I6_MEDTR|nr:40S ribosomal S10-like protein, putative [Medicago truncatula]
MDNLFNVRDDVTLKDLNDQLNEINKGLNHIDIRRVKYVWYERPSFNSKGRLTFNRPELTNDDDVRKNMLF